MNCYCGSGKAFQNCCQRIHQSQKLADSAEDLMRSRYSAYVLGEAEFLSKTWLDNYCPPTLEIMSEVRWCGLEIVSTKAGLESDQRGWVEFKARYIENDKIYCLHEISCFQKNEGLWFYKDGQLFEHESETISLNQSCPCASGKKYKRCCRNFK